MKASTVSVPLLCCSAPLAVSTMAVDASPSSLAASSNWATGTPVIRSTRSGQYERTNRRTCSKPQVRSAMYSVSMCPSRIARCSSPLASARSVPGTGCRCSFEPRAVEERRGSMVICVAPRLRPSSNHCIAGGMVSAGLAPTSRMTSAAAISDSGNGRPRSMPKARLVAAAAEDMQNRPL